MTRRQGWRFFWAAAMAGCLLTAGIETAAQAKYGRPQLEKVPLARVTKNLEEQAAKTPKDAAVQFNLARAYAMGYASKVEMVEVTSGEGGGIWYGYEPAHVPFTAAPAADEKAKQAAAQSLAKATMAYEAGLALEPKNLTAALGRAWCVDQAGDKKKAVQLYREIVQSAWKDEKELKTAGLGWHSVTAEAAGYLIPLLDAETDKTEIAELNAQAAAMKKVLRPITPVVVPLREGLAAADLLDRSASVAFDADGSGQGKRFNWITADAAWLVHRRTEGETITSGLQLFGTVTFWMFWDHGYQALASLDDNHDGELRGDELKGLALWHDANRNGICEPGEVRPLGEYGIVAVSCRGEVDRADPDRIWHAPKGITFRDGSTRPTWDVVLTSK